MGTGLGVWTFSDVGQVLTFTDPSETRSGDADQSEGRQHGENPSNCFVNATSPVLDLGPEPTQMRTHPDTDWQKVKTCDTRGSSEKSENRLRALIELKWRPIERTAIDAVRMRHGQFSGA